MGIGRLGRIGSNLNHDDVRSHGGRVDGLTYTSMGMYGSADTQRFVKDETPREYTNMYNDWANLSTRRINSNTYMSGHSGFTATSDYSGMVDVDEQFFDMGASSPGPGTYRIWLAHQVTTNTTFYNDTPICGVQVLDIQGNVLETIGLYDSNNAIEWENLTGTNSGQQSDLLNPYTRNSADYSWTDVTSSTSVGKFSTASSTGSQYTGIKGGVDLTGYASKPFPVGYATMAQVDTLSYLFRGTSGSTRYTYAVMRTKNAYTIPRYGSIRVIHANTTLSTQSIDPSNTLFVGIA